MEEEELLKLTQANLMGQLEVIKSKLVAIDEELARVRAQKSDKQRNTPINDQYDEEEGEEFLARMRAFCSKFTNRHTHNPFVFSGSESMGLTGDGHEFSVMHGPDGDIILYTESKRPVQISVDEALPEKNNNPTPVGEDTVPEFADYERMVSIARDTFGIVTHVDGNNVTYVDRPLKMKEEPQIQPTTLKLSELSDQTEKTVLESNILKHYIAVAMDEMKSKLSERVATITVPIIHGHIVTDFCQHFKRQSISCTVEVSMVQRGAGVETGLGVTLRW
jgi:hypothetical protein